MDFSYSSGFSCIGSLGRQIRSIQKTMQGLSKENRRSFDDESFSTLFTEVEQILNSGPLTPLPDDSDCLEALTLNHLLRACLSNTLPPGNFSKNDIYSRRRWRQIQYFADKFWLRWRKKYLPLLQERRKWQLKRRSHAVGDLVLLIETNVPRNNWPLGRVVRVYRDAQGMVRDLEVQISRVKGEFKLKPVIVHRPITKLILLIPDSNELNSSLRIKVYQCPY